MINNLLPILGLLVTAIGIPILYLQLRDLKASLRSSTHASIYAQAEAVRGYTIQQLQEVDDNLQSYNDELNS